MKYFLFSVRPLAFDLATTAFFYGVLATTGDVRLATALGILLGVLQVAFMAVTRRPIAPMQWMGLALVVVMGGATMITHDPRFVLVKASVVYAAIGLTMLQPGWMMRYIPPIAVENLPRNVIVAFGYLWALLMFGTGALNLYLTLTTGPKVVATVMSLWAPGSKIALFAFQFLSMRWMARRRYLARQSRGSGLVAGERA